MERRPEEIGDSEWLKLASVYEHPDMIDLFIGGLSEKHVPGNLL